MGALRLTGSVLGALGVTLVFCFLAPLIIGKPVERVSQYVTPVRVVPVTPPKSLEKEKILPKKMLKITRVNKKPIPRKQTIAPANVRMRPLKMEAAPVMAASLPLPPAPDEPGKATAGTPGPATPGVWATSAVDRMPKLRRYTPPLYPPKAKGQKIEGKVVVRCVVSAGGRVRRAEVVQADPAGYFEKAAIRSVKKWTFIPAELNGKKVAVFVDIPLSFSLD